MTNKLCNGIPGALETLVGVTPCVNESFISVDIPIIIQEDENLSRIPSNMSEDEFNRWMLTQKYI